ncbi:MAG: hypothetical protein GX181_04065 [Synergistaceae bacterium]|nr:hypothetical protein [Synergistota bacterium]NLM71124.1 hypothetical protein [Synergistaceae bacterium]
MRVFRLLLVAILLVLSALPAIPARAQAEGELIKVEAEGFAPIKGGDKSGAREAAKRSAYRDALEKALGAHVTGITEMRDFEVVKDKVFSQTTGLVKQFDIVREKVGDDGILHITAICHVARVALDGVLGPAVLDALGNPRVMVLLDERIEDKPSFLSTAESEVMRVFEKAGYLLVDSTQAVLLKNIDLGAAIASGDPEFFRQLARDFQADVLIYGKAYASSFANQMISGVRIYGVRSTVQLKAVLANTAYQLGSDAVEEKTKGVSVEDGAIKGLQPAAGKASKSIVHKIAYALVSGSAGGIPGRTVKVKISNLTFRDAKALKESLQDIDGVTGVYQRLFRERRLELDVVSEFTSEEIASILSDFGYDIEDLSSATVEGVLNEKSE